VPDGDEASLYIRPFMIATDSFVGRSSSDKYTFSIFTCPVDAYYKGSVRGKSGASLHALHLVGRDLRKLQATMPARLYPSQLARKEGYDQLIWTDALDP
jgi:branched-chain amino acid aminotransferase